MYQYQYNMNFDELIKRVDELKHKLLSLLDLLHYYQNDVYQEIMFRYDNIFGDLEDEIDDKSQESVELERKVELLRLKMRKGETINDNSLRFVNLIVQREAQRNNTFDKSSSFHNSFKKSNVFNNSESQVERNKYHCEVNNNYELPLLYRNLVKKLHPDVSGESDEFNRFWDNVQHAYRSSDVERLRLLHLSLCTLDNISSVKQKNAEVALKTQIFELEQSIKQQENRIRSMKKQEPYNLEDKLNDKNWIARQKNLLRERIFQIDRKIQHHSKLLSNLTDRTFITEENARQNLHAV